MAFAPNSAQTCIGCVFYDVQGARCHRNPPPFGFCAPSDGCGDWQAYTGATRTPPTNTDERKIVDQNGYTP